MPDPTTDPTTSGDGHDRVVTADGTVWTRPGPGTWVYASDHVAHAVTASYEELYGDARSAGLRDAFARYGLPAADMAVTFLHGHMYDRLVPLVGAGSDAPPPPAPILWIATRVHPTFRARTRAAATTFAPRRRWRDEAETWEATERQRWFERNLELTDVDVDGLDDAALATHLDAVVAHYRRAVERHFSLKGADSLPLGDLLALTNDLGLPTDDVLGLLRGASPTSGVPAPLAALADAVRDALAGGRARPADLDDVRALGPEVAARLDAYLREFGWRIVTGYDIDGACLGELPEVVLRTILAVVDDPPAVAARPEASASAALHDRVPASARAELDERFAEALVAYGIRDENGPLTFQWPAGLVRRAMLAAGRRLAAAGLLDEAQHAVDLRTDEVRALLRGAASIDGEDAATVARARVERRAERDRLDPPAQLGPPEVAPALRAMPAMLARSVRGITAFLETMTGTREARAALAGQGVGTEAYTGRAVVAASADEAFERLAAGDVLVAPCTTPAYNCILPLVGAIVTEEGGALCHAAIVARELGLAAVVGALDATTAIRDGDLVEVDPAAGRVRVVGTAPVPEPALA